MSHEITAKLIEYRELKTQLSIVCKWLETQAHKYCKCENNGDYCEFHHMLFEAIKALK